MDYLLGNYKEPFDRGRSPLQLCSKKTPTKSMSSVSADDNARMLFVGMTVDPPLYDVDFVLSEHGEKSAPLILQSAKMQGLKSLFGTKKLNTSAIQLQLTMQSQVDVKKSLDDSSSVLRPKRSCRE